MRVDERRERRHRRGRARSSSSASVSGAWRAVARVDQHVAVAALEQDVVRRQPVADEDVNLRRQQRRRGLAALASRKPPDEIADQRHAVGERRRGALDAHAIRAGEADAAVAAARAAISDAGSNGGCLTNVQRAALRARRRPWRCRFGFATSRSRWHASSACAGSGGVPKRSTSSSCIDCELVRRSRSSRAACRGRAARARRCSRLAGSSAGTCRLISVATPSGADRSGSRPGLQRRHGGLQHVRVELEADFLHLARLRLAEHLARAANLEIVHREVEPRAQVLHHLDRLEALARLRRTALSAGGVSRYAYAWWCERPTRPRSWWSWARPKRSARSMMIVFAVGTSMPVSMIVEHTSRLMRCA